MKPMRAYVAPLCLVLALTGTVLADEVRHIEVQGIQRAVDIHLPNQVTAGPRPLVIVLHGLNSNGPRTRRWFNLDTIADREGFVAAYPTALGGRWSYGKALADPIVTVNGNSIDDLTLIERLAANLAQENVVDPKRVYIVGISNGGLMAYRVACEKPRMLAAMAALIIGMTKPQMEACIDHSPLPILILGGTADRIHYEGRRFRQGQLLSMFETMWYWHERNGCTSKSVRTLPDLEKNDGSTVTLSQYRGCTGGADIDYFVVDNGLHDVPQVHRDPSAAIKIGANRDMETADEVWRFFSRYSL